MIRRWAVVGVAALLLVLSVAAPAAATSAPPDGSLSNPGSGALRAVGAIELQGSATDDVGVSAVRVAIQDRASKLWLRIDGSWGAWQQHTATLATVGAPTTTWTWTWASAPAGSFAVQVEARDGDGQRDPTRGWTAFVVGAAPDSTIDAPAPAASLSAPVLVSGMATDDRAVREVRLAIQDRTSKLWLRADGTFGAYQWHRAALGSPGATSTTWLLGGLDLPAGSFQLIATAVDSDGIVDPTRSRVAFTVRQPGSALLSFIIGRDDWVASDDCTPADGAVPLDRVAAELSARGISAAIGVVTPRTLEHDRRCQGGAILGASWDDLAWLRDAHGWSAFPRSTAALDAMPVEQAYAESCGALDVLTAHGHHRGWGLFAYANDALDESLQETLVSTCFAYGRDYGHGQNRRDSLVVPWWQSTRSVNGGRCALATAPCAAMAVANGRTYEGPPTLLGLLSPSADVWSSVQLYRFVEGVHSGPGGSWDCTAADWRLHWTSRAELYCFADLLTAVDAMPADVVIADPATVAEAWGRAPGT